MVSIFFLRTSLRCGRRSNCCLRLNCLGCILRHRLNCSLTNGLSSMMNCGCNCCCCCLMNFCRSLTNFLILSNFR